MKSVLNGILICLLASIVFGCSATHKVAYPSGDDLFVTMGDDPASESQKPYTPKGTFIHVTQESHLPIPVLGLIPLGNAEPQYVFETYVFPQVTEMGGDALTNARVDHKPRPGFFTRLFGLGFFSPSHTVVTGQVVKR